MRVSHVHPPRLIDVNLPERDIVRLCSPEPTRLDNYAALSYCWGADQSIKTSLVTLSTHEAGIPIQSLPQTLQDAIHVTRQLDIGFLWVDSLCIIQDSPEDLDKEIADMSHYFGNALVTLCAAAPKSCAEGFLGQKCDESRYVLGPFYFPMRNPFGETIGRIKLVEEDNASKEAIDTRAWTLQEALLSSRLITFGSRQIRWSCQSASYGRLEISGLRKEVEFLKQKTADSRDSTLLSRIYSREVSTIPYPVHPWRVLVTWYSIVRAYKVRAISFPQDLLPAISGVAREFAAIIAPPVRKDMPKYLAGLWNVEFPLQLLWSTFPSKAERPSVYRAPSWSWAALDGPVLRTYPLLGICTAELVDCKVDHLNPQAPYGAVSGGSITLKGHLQNAPHPPNSGFREGISRTHFDTDEDSKMARDGTMQVWCLEIVSFDEDIKMSYQPKGLILVRNGDGTYRRAGICCSSHSLVFSEMDPKKNITNVIIV
jgi:hypothetical protein